MPGALGSIGVNFGACCAGSDWNGSMPPATHWHWTPVVVVHGRPTHGSPSGLSLGHLRTQEPPWHSCEVVQPDPQTTGFPQLSVELPQVAEPQLLLVGVQQAPLARQVCPPAQAPFTVAQFTAWPQLLVTVPQWREPHAAALLGTHWHVLPTQVCEALQPPLTEAQSTACPQLFVALPQVLPEHAAVLFGAQQLPSG
jgi:hypothetical protein